MNKKIISIIASVIILAAAYLVASQKDILPTKNRVACFDTIKYENLQTTKEVQEYQEIYTKMTRTIPVIENANLKKFIDTFNTNNLNEMLKTTDINSPDDLAWYKETHKNLFDYTVMGSIRAAKDFVTYESSEYSYTGGAHGSSWVRYFVFADEAFAKPLSYFEIFKPQTYNQFIEKVVLDKIAQMYKDDPEYFASFNTGEDSYGRIGIQKALQLSAEGKAEYEPNVVIQNGKLTLVFDQYSIAPYAAGMPEFTFKVSDIAEYLQPTIVGRSVSCN